ncbi:MAG: hypothetical protein KGM43_19455 [Planctomycetota bacterium]|nr:hypothetical protein [Planctomycetota bacterium]
MIATLVIATILSATSTADDTGPTTEGVRAAISKALPPIVKSVEEYPKHRDCFSCHHQAVPVFALTTARARGFDVKPETIAAAVEHTEADLRTELDAYKKGTGQPGGVTRAGYALFTLEAGGKSPDEVTSAVAFFLRQRNASGDRWRTSSSRPPSEASDFTSTYLALRALAVYGQNEPKVEVAQRVEKARRWLEATSPKDTEDRVFRLLALRQSSASHATIRAAADALLATQRNDGGWSQLNGGTSDAYATGSALVALHNAGKLATDDPRYRRGLRFLIADQHPDGTWLVHSRSKPFQPYFESGFPYGKDQFISMSASSWSLAALALAYPKP